MRENTEQNNSEQGYFLLSENIFSLLLTAIQSKNHDLYWNILGTTSYGFIEIVKTILSAAPEASVLLLYSATEITSVC